MKKCLNTLFIFIFIICTSCNNDKENKIDALQIKQDSVIHHDSLLQAKELPSKPQINYTGSYKLLVDRHGNCTAYHTLELLQSNDSLKGTYSLELLNPDDKLLVSLKGNVLGKMTDDLNNKNSNSQLYIYLTKKDLDTVALQSYPAAEYAYRQFLYEPSVLGMRYSIKKNTIENNYAGGEWDTWERIK